MSYTIRTSSSGAKSIQCHHCGRTSSSARDVQMRYCGNCHRYHGDMAPRPTQHHATGVDDGYWVRRQQEESSRPLFDSFADSSPSSSEPVCRPDTSIDYGNSSSSWDSSSSCDSSSSSSSDSGSCSGD